MSWDKMKNKKRIKKLIIQVDPNTCATFLAKSTQGILISIQSSTLLVRQILKDSRQR